MKDGPKREPTKDLLDFMRKHWLEGEGSDRILFNTLANQDLQRRVFSHSKRRIDIVGPSVGTKNAEALLEKIPDLTKPDGIFSFPFTEDKIDKIYEEFEVLAKDITEHPGWEEFWEDWETSFKQAILENPEGYLTEEQLVEYRLEGESYINDFIKEQKPEVQKRVKGGYCFKMLTELLASPNIPKHQKLNKDVCVMLQTISNHKDHLTPKQMSHYINDNQENRLQNRIKSGREELFIKSALYMDPEAALDIEELKEIINKVVNGYDQVIEKPGEEPQTVHHEGLVDSKEYQQMDKGRREKLIHDNFTSQRALDAICDNIERRAMYKKIKSMASDFLTNPEHKEMLEANPSHEQKIKTFIKLADQQEVGHSDIPLEISKMNEVFANPDEISKLCAHMELLSAHEHLNRGLDTFVQKILHETKTKEDLATHYHLISANDHVNNDHASVALMVDMQIEKLNSQEPSLDSLVELRRVMELDPSDNNREAYYNAIERAKSLPGKNIEDCLTVATVREKWIIDISTNPSKWAGGFINDANLNAKAFGPPMSDSKMLMLCRELQDLNDSLFEDSTFKEDMAKLPLEVQESTKRHLAQQLRNIAITQCAFYDGVEMEPEQKEQKLSQLKSTFTEISETFDKVPGNSLEEKSSQLHKQLVESKSQKLSQEVLRLCDKTKQSILDGKKLVDAIGELQGHIKRIKMSDYFNYLEESEATKLLAPLTEMHHDYKTILDKVNGQLNDIGSKFIPLDGKDSGHIVQELIDKAAESIQEDEAFERRPYVGQIALQRHIMSNEAQVALKDKATVARTQHFGLKIESIAKDKDFAKTFKSLLENKQDGLKWIRFHPARREVLSKLATEITEGKHGFSKRNGFQKFFGMKLTGKQQTAIKALQKEFLLCLKVEMAQSQTNEEALKILEANRNHPLLKPIEKASFGQLFSGKDKSAKTEIDNLARVISHAPKTSSPSDLKLLSSFKGLEADVEKQNEFSYMTSPEFDVAHGLNARLSKVLSEEEMLQKASDLSLLEDLKNKQVASLKDPNKHQDLLDSLNEIEDPSRRMDEIQSLFAMAHNNQMFDYHNSMHLKHKDYGPVQEKAIIMLQDAYLEAMKQEVFKQVWLCKEGVYDPEAHEYRSSDFDFSEINMHPESFPNELESKHKNEIYNEILGPAKSSSILTCHVKEGRIDEIKSELSNMTEVLNHMYDPGTPEFMRVQMDKQTKEKFATSPEVEKRSKLRT